MGYAHKFLGCFLLLYLVVFSPLQAQQDEPVKPFNNTLQLNATGLAIKTAGLVYTRHIGSGHNLMIEGGYAFTRSAGVSNNIRNFENERVRGYFIKAGPEFCRFKNDLKSFSFALLLFYGQGEFEQEVVIRHPLGEYRKPYQNEYKTYGVGFMVSQVFFNIRDRWFIEGSMELNLPDIRTGAEIPLKEYPGVGGVAKFGVGLRMMGKVGVRF